MVGVHRNGTQCAAILASDIPGLRVFDGFFGDHSSYSELN